MNLKTCSRRFVLLAIVSITTIALADTNTVDSNAFVPTNLPVAPTSLAQLLALSPQQLEKCDIARMNLLCAEGLPGAENLNIQENLDTLDTWARHVDDETFRNLHRFWEHPEAYNNSLAYYRMIMLATVLQQDLGVHYSPERALPQLLGQREPNDIFYADAKDIFIGGILGRERQGTCSSLPVLYVAVAQRLGYPVDLASTEEHLYLRYEEGTNHLNVDAAGEGFITHPDEEYRKWPHSLTDEEIKTYGYLQPMRKQQILGAFLAMRAMNLTSAKKFDEAAQSWEAVSRYLPPTPVLQNIVEMAKERASDVHKAARWAELWDAVVTQPIPEDALDYFQNRQVQVLQLMESSTDLAAMEKAAADLKNEVDEYAKEMTTDTHKVQFRISLVPPPLRLLQTAGPEQLLADELFPKVQRMIFPAELVPLEYLRSVPPELMNRLRKLNNEREMIEEMRIYSMEEMELQNLKSQNATEQAQFQSPPPLSFGEKRQTDISPQDLPLPWRGKPVPQELQDRLASFNEQNASPARIKQIIDGFFMNREQDQIKIDAIQTRRRLLDEQPAERPPFQIEVVPQTPAPGNIHF